MAGEDESEGGLESALGVSGDATVSAPQLLADKLKHVQTRISSRTSAGDLNHKQMKRIEQNNRQLKQKRSYSTRYQICSTPSAHIDATGLE